MHLDFTLYVCPGKIRQTRWGSGDVFSLAQQLPLHKVSEELFPKSRLSRLLTGVIREFLPSPDASSES